MAIDDHLSNEDEIGKREKLKGQVQSIVREILKESVIQKTATQLLRRIRTVRARMKEHLARKNPLAVSTVYSYLLLLGHTPFLVIAYYPWRKP